MDRRAFLRMLGCAPIVAAAAALPAAAVAVEITTSVEPSPFWKATFENMRRFSAALTPAEIRAVERVTADEDDLRGPTFDNADDLIADLHS